MRELSKEEVALIESLKINFSGSNDYLSGANDGMYALIQHLELPKLKDPHEVSSEN